MNSSNWLENIWHSSCSAVLPAQRDVNVESCPPD